MKSKSTLQLNSKTKIRLARFGFKLSSWDSILNALMDHAEKCDIYGNDIQ